MTLDEYVLTTNTTTSWEPGWIAIHSELVKCYGKGAVEEREAAPDSPLLGFALGRSAKGYVNVVSKGISQVLPEPDALNGFRSGWGFELSIKLPTDVSPNYEAAFALLERIARYINARKLPIRPFDILSFSGNMKYPQLESADFAGAVVIKDTDLPVLNTLHGTVNFLQLVNVRRDELSVLRDQPQRIHQFAHNLKADYPYMEIDTEREKAYLV